MSAAPEQLVLDLAPSCPPAPAERHVWSYAEVVGLLERGVDDHDDEPEPEVVVVKLPASVLLDGVRAELGDDASLRTLARRLGVDPSVLSRPMTPWAIDRYACRLGLHPGTVWPGWWD